MPDSPEKLVNVQLTGTTQVKYKRKVYRPSTKYQLDQGVFHPTFECEENTAKVLAEKGAVTLVKTTTRRSPSTTKGSGT